MAAPTLDSVLKQAQRLPSGERLALAERLLQSNSKDEQAAMVAVRRFADATQLRFEALMGRHTEGRLTASEQAELRALVARYEKMLLTNSQALLHATHPQLFEPNGRLVKRRLTHALRRKRARSHNGHG